MGPRAEILGSSKRLVPITPGQSTVARVPEMSSSWVFLSAILGGVSRGLGRGPVHNNNAS